MDIEPLSEDRQALIQTFIAQRGLRLADLDRVLQAIHGDALPTTQITAAYIADEISALNTALSKFDLEIRRTIDQRVGGDFWVLVNAAADPITQLATLHSPNEIAYFRCLLYVICSTHNTLEQEALAVPQNEALSYAAMYPTGYEASQLNLDAGRADAAASAAASGKATPTSRKKARLAAANSDNDLPPSFSPIAPRTTQLQGPGLTRSQAQQALNKFVQEGWLHKTSQDCYILTPKSLMELHTYLQEMYGPDEEEAEQEDEADDVQRMPRRRPRKAMSTQLIKPCTLCREFTLIGYRCPNLVCSARIHTFCYKKWIDMRGGQDAECPTCKKRQWVRKQMLQVGERALMEGDRVTTSEPSSVTRNRVQTQMIGRVRRDRAALLDDEEEENDLQQLPMASSQQDSLANGAYDDDE